MFSKYAVEIGDSLWTSLYDAVNAAEYGIHGVYEEGDQKFAVLQNLADEKFYRVNFSFGEEKFTLAEEMTDITESYSEETHFSAEAVEEYAKKKKKEEEKEEEPENKGEEKKPEGEEDPKEDKKPEDEEDEDKKKKKKNYNLEEIVEYAELQTSYSTLETKYNELEIKFNTMKTEYDSLLAFKSEVEKAKKQEMIDSFYMLSDEDKKDVIENINEYSLDDIEAKLSIICVRNKVSFDLNDNKGDSGEGSDPTIYNLGNDGIDDTTPAWVKAIQKTARNK